MPKQLRKSDIVRLVQFASWADTEHMTYQRAEALLNDFLERMGVSPVDVDDPDDFDLSELGLL